jgi:hypothetical protein
VFAKLQLRIEARSWSLFWKEAAMKPIKWDAFVIFALFFGVAALEAVQTRNWIKAVFWLAIGTAFLLADNFRRVVPRKP